MKNVPTIYRNVNGDDIVKYIFLQSSRVSTEEFEQRAAKFGKTFGLSETESISLAKEAFSKM